jgi:WD40 repeat protein
MEIPDLSTLVYPAIVAILLWLFYAFGVRERIIGLSNSNHEPREIIDNSASMKSKTSEIPDKKYARKHTKSESICKSAVNQFNHPWLAATLKAHMNSVQNLHFSANGNMLASCATDRTVHLWSTKDFLERDHKQIRVNVEFDSASRVHWSPDNKAFLIAKTGEKSIEVFKLGKKRDGSIGNITKSALKYCMTHEDSIVGLGIACSGKFMMTCSSNSHLAIWDLKGNLLDEMIIANGVTHAAKVSICGRFVGVAGEYNSSPSLIIREVIFKDNKKYAGVGTAFMGGDHQVPVYAFDFNTDSSKIVSLDNKGSWKLFDTSGNRMDVVKNGTVKLLSATTKPVVSLSHDGRVILVTTGPNIEIYSAITGASLHRIENCHSEPIRDIQFSFDDAFFVTCGDRVINVFNNICGYQETLQDLRLQLSNRSISQALKNRLSKQVTMIETKLSDLNT